ncbi:MAG TPA: proliferating cell nuclear antigen (pcna) [Candidatus Bilamarchaeaceae archaeon]|nr:proliferating cell nuclear antigen (pcna) [Candidatus Bilamarchaeaceae archaeon]
MKITIGDSTALKDAVDSIVNLVEEGLFEITNEGVRLKAMDPSQISMISFFMPKEAFSQYALEEERKLGVDVDKLSKVLARGGRGESAELGLEDGKLKIIFGGGKKRRTFKLPLIEVGSGLEREPKIEYRNHVKVDSEALKEMLKDAKLVSSHVRLILEEGHFRVEIKGDDGEVKEEFEKDAEEVKELKVAEGSRATFPLQYMEDIVKASKPGTQVTIYLETDRPLKVEYDVMGAKSVYYLAPRIESG